jgi:hypothetical protein
LSSFIFPKNETDIGETRPHVTIANRAADPLFWFAILQPMGALGHLLTVAVVTIVLRWLWKSSIFDPAKFEAGRHLFPPDTPHAHSDIGWRGLLYRTVRLVPAGVAPTGGVVGTLAVSRICRFGFVCLPAGFVHRGGWDRIAFLVRGGWPAQELGADLAPQKIPTLTSQTARR